MSKSASIDSEKSMLGKLKRGKFFKSSRSCLNSYYFCLFFSDFNFESLKDSYFASSCHVHGNQNIVHFQLAKNHIQIAGVIGTTCKLRKPWVNNI